MSNDIYKILNNITIAMYNNFRHLGVSLNNGVDDTFANGYQAAMDDLFTCIRRLTSLVEEEEKKLNTPVIISSPSTSPIAPIVNPYPYTPINEPYTISPTWTCNTQTTTQTKENSHG